MSRTEAKKGRDNESARGLPAHWEDEIRVRYALEWGTKPVYIPRHPRTLTIASTEALVFKGFGFWIPISFAIMTSSCLRT